MNNYCAEPQAHPDRCGCKPDSFQIARHSRRLVEQQRERIAALEAECERLADELDRTSVITGDYIARCQRLADERDALAAERARADVAVADANDAERALVAVTAERDRLRADLAAETQKRWDGNEQSSREHREEIDQLRAEVDGLRNEHAARESMARRLLWLAFVWNDHNFLDAHIEARREAEAHGITTLEQANEWLSRIDATLAAKEA